VTSLILIRHGETDWNRDRRIQGSTDIPLNDTGRRQAKDAAAALRDRLDHTVTPTIVSSDLSRARETAAIIADDLGLAAPLAYPGLRERSYGEAEGIDADEFFRRWGDWHAAAVPGAEPRPQLLVRGIAALVEAVRVHRLATAPSSASLLVVTHGAMIREILGHASGGELPAPGEKLANGSAHELLFERDRLRVVSYEAALS
jgi:broad specificity phosphatase PhoE